MDQLTVATHNHKLQFWISRIKECKASGLIVESWCREQEINIKTYYYWMHKIKHEAFDALPAEQKSNVAKQPVLSGDTFAEIPVSMTGNGADVACCVRTGNIVLEIYNGADDATVRNTLQAVRSLC